MAVIEFGLNSSTEIGEAVMLSIYLKTKTKRTKGRDPSSTRVTDSKTKPL